MVLISQFYILLGNKLPHRFLVIITIINNNNNNNNNNNSNNNNNNMVSRCIILSAYQFYHDFGNVGVVQDGIAAG